MKEFVTADKLQHQKYIPKIPQPPICLLKVNFSTLPSSCLPNNRWDPYYQMLGKHDKGRGGENLLVLNHVISMENGKWRFPVFLKSNII